MTESDWEESALVGGCSACGDLCSLVGSVPVSGPRRMSMGLGVVLRLASKLRSPGPGVAFSDLERSGCCCCCSVGGGIREGGRLEEPLVACWSTTPTPFGDNEPRTPDEVGVGTIFCCCCCVSTSCICICCCCCCCWNELVRMKVIACCCWCCCCCAFICWCCWCCCCWSCC